MSTVNRVETSAPAARQHEAAQRYDIYAVVHKGLRAFLGDTLAQVGRIDAFDAEDVARGAASVRALLDACRAHLHHEDRHLHPAMEARRPGSAARTADDHLEHGEAIEALEHLVQALESSAGAERQANCTRLYRQLSLFVAENLVHMQVEETHNMAVLWGAYTDAELLAIEQAIVASIPPERALQFMRWMLPYANHAERVALLTGMRAAAPVQAFQAVLAVVRAHLTDKEWAKLQGALA